ncbi:hypothetical protein Cni_G06909 [Canna indica]|uniref:DUF8204 domain-containing protein n=1 Tax=Canna indica TaxID=4628 RepID=A0AAQ3Q718_9LILI|nr:hypothetical protein Cni_G06909 [Canna indica]
MAEKTADAVDSGHPSGGGDGDGQRYPKASTYKGKSCKGCLYYSSRLKSDARNPVCVGISRSLPQVPNYVAGESETEVNKDGRSLSDFKYACVGYSVFHDKKDHHAERSDNQAELPFCAGIELLADRRVSSADHVPANPHNEDVAHHREHRTHRPAHSHSLADEFFNRFRKNAGLVASGVAKNLNKVGSYIKENIDDILYSYRRPPK